jgi:hypothetical protein
MIKFKYISDEERHVIDIPEVYACRIAAHEASIHKNLSYKRKYEQAAINYLRWFIGYCDYILKGKVYTDAQLVPQLFSTRNLAQPELREYFRTSLYAAKLYCEYLVGRITFSNVMKYNHTLTSLGIDLEWLIVSHEVHVKKTIPRADLTSGRRANLSPEDIFSAARELFFIEELNSIEDLYLRDLKPVVIFQIRQLIEVFGKNLLGYNDITDKNDNSVKKFTQVAWEFIALEAGNVSPRIELPFPVNFVKIINSWANNFVHTSFIFNSYVQFYALRILTLLLNGSGSRIKTFDNRWHTKTHIADIKIYRYHELRAAFEDYLKLKKPDAKVSWMPENKVGAYIISL